MGYPAGMSSKLMGNRKGGRMGKEQGINYMDFHPLAQPAAPSNAASVLLQTREVASTHSSSCPRSEFSIQLLGIHFPLSSSKIYMI